MNDVEIKIDGRHHGFHEVWVHLQDVSHQNSVQYRISVAATYVRQVFDPYSTKGPESSWADFILGMITKLGTFIIEGFIDNMGAIVGEHEKAYYWVIATVDEVIESEKGIELISQAVPFVPNGRSKAIKLLK
jgi:hypothetical protein